MSQYLKHHHHMKMIQGTSIYVLEYLLSFIHICWIIVIYIFQRCGPYSFTCSNQEESIHFKFENFETEKGYDYVFIGKTIEQGEDFDIQNTVGGEDQVSLRLDGQNQTDAWVHADSIPNFNIFFYRQAIKMST